MTTALGYVRQSRRRDSEASPESQRDSIASYCRSQGWDLKGYHEDIGRSGWDPAVHRAGWEALMADLDGVDLVVVRDLSRLSRQGIQEALRLVGALEEHGVRLVSVAEPFLDTSTAIGSAIFGLFAAFARQESDLRSEKVTEAKAHIRANGARFQGGPLPWGLVKGPEGHLVASPAAPEVRRVATNLLQGASLRAEVQRLNEEGHLNGQGRPWNGMGLRRAMASPYLVGHAPDGSGGVLRGPDGLPVVAHEAILDLGTWHALQRRLDKPQGSGPKVPTLLAGLGRCGRCGTTMRARRASNALRCPSDGCGRVTITMDRLEAWVAAQAALRLAALEPEDLADVATRFLEAEGVPTAAPERAEVEASLAETNAALERLDEAMVDGLLDRDRYTVQVDRLVARRNGLEERLASLAGPALDLSILLDPLSAGDSSESGLLGLPCAPALIRAVVESFTVDPQPEGTPRSRWAPEGRVVVQWA